MRAKRIATLGGVWISLFVATLLILRARESLAVQGAELQDVDSEQLVAQLASKQLRAKRLAELSERPTRTNAVYYSAIASVDGFLSQKLSEEFLEHIDALRPCKMAAMQRSARTVEFMEISFKLEMIELGRYAVSDVQFERSTMATLPVDEACIVDAVRTFTLKVEHAPVERIRFPICFRQS